MLWLRSGENGPVETADNSGQLVLTVSGAVVDLRSSMRIMFDWWPGLWKSAAKWLHATKPGEVRRAGSNPVQSSWEAVGVLPVVAPVQRQGLNSF